MFDQHLIAARTGWDVAVIVHLLGRLLLLDLCSMLLVIFDKLVVLLLEWQSQLLLGGVLGCHIVVSFYGLIDLGKSIDVAVALHLMMLFLLGRWIQLFQHSTNFFIIL